MAAKKCLICNCAFRGRADAKTCSPRCRKRLQQVRFSLAHSERGKGAWRKTMAIILLGLIGFLSIFFSAMPKAGAITSSTNLNFQARLTTNTGAIVPDGTYNIDFKIYNADSTTGTVGTCSGACLWEETRKNFNSQGVQVINGYLSVNLGSVNSFPSTINWDQQLYLTMNIGGTSSGASPTWDGEMQNAGHSVALTAVPLAFKANQLQINNGTQTGTLKFGTVANSPVITLPDATGTVCLQSASACGFVLGSGTAFLQGGNSFGATGTLGTTDGNALNIITNSHVVQSLSSTGAATFKNFSDSNAAFQVQNSSNSSVFTVNTTNQTIGIGTSPSTSTTLSIKDGTGSSTTSLKLIQSGSSTDTTLLQGDANGTLLDSLNNNLTLSSTNSVVVKPESGRDSSTAFQVQSAGSLAIVDVSTVSNTQNLLNNPSFESNTGFWGEYNGTSTVFATSTTNPQSGTQSLQVTAAASVSRGAAQIVTLKPFTQYTFSVYASLSTNNSGVTTGAAKFDIGAVVNGSDVTCTGSGNNLTFTTSVTRYACTFTTGGTVTASDEVFVRRQSTDANIRSIHIDAAQLEMAGSATTFADQAYPNIVTTPNFEVGTGGWSAKSTATLSQSTDTAQFNNQSLKVVTTAAGQGAAYSNYNFNASSRYSLSFYARTASASQNYTIGRQDQSGTDVDTGCTNGTNSITVTTTWTQYTCTFTTGSSITAPTSFYIKQSGAGTPTLYIDGVTLVASGVAQAFIQPAASLQADPLYGNLSLNSSNVGEIQPWQQNANSMPDSRYSGGTVIANGYIYWIAGAQFGTDKTDVYYAKLNKDGSTGAWTTSAYAAPALERFASVVASGYVYIIGGNNGSASAAVYSAKLNADGSTGAWQTSPNPLPATRQAVTAVVANGYIYVVGGYDNGGTPVGSVYYAKYNADGTTGSWNTGNLGAMNAAVLFDAVTANGYLYVISGNQSFSDTTNVYYAKLNADGSFGTWTQSPNNLPNVRKYYATVVSNGYVYIMGGYSGVSTEQNSVYYAKLNADGTTGAWQTSANSIPLAVERAGTGIYNGYIYYIGGLNASTPYSTVYYTSTSRILVGGTLDLVGLSGLDVSDGGNFSQGSAGGNLIAGNTSIIGTLQVQGQANFVQGVAVGGNLTVSGTGLFQTTTDSTKAFALQDSQGNNFLQFNSTASSITLGSQAGKSITYVTHQALTPGNSPTTPFQVSSSDFTISGPNPALIVNIGIKDASATVTGVTWSGGGTGYQVNSLRAGTANTYVSVWAIPAPTAGTGHYTITFSGSGVPYQADGQVFNNVDQTTPAVVADSVTTSGNDVTSLTLTPPNMTSIDAIVAAGGNSGTGGDPSGITPNTTYSDATSLINLQTGYRLGVGSVTGNWTTPSSSTEVLVAARLQGIQTSTTNIQSGAGGINITPTGTGNTGVLVKPTNNSASAFQIQNANALPIFDVSTISNNQNLITNPNFESNTTGWAALNGATLSTVSTMAQSGTQSLQAVLAAGNASDGVKYTYPFKPLTTYSLSVYAAITSGSTSTFEMGTVQNGGAQTNCGVTGVTLTSSLTRYTCTFTTGSTTTGSDYFYFKRTTAAAGTLVFDAAQLEIASSATAFTDQIYQNLLTNPNIEANTNGFAKRQVATTTSTITSSDDFAKYGNRSLKVVTGTGNGNGVNYQYNFAPSTRYTFNFWGRRDTSSTSTINVGRVEKTYGPGNASQSTTTVTAASANFTTAGVTVGSMIVFADGTADTVTAVGTTTLTVTQSRTVGSQTYTVYINASSECLTGQTFNTTWTQFTCTFTTGSSITNGSSYLYIRQTDTSTDNLYIDGLTLTANGVGQTYVQPAASLQADPLYGNLSLNNSNVGEIQPWQQNANISCGGYDDSAVAYNGYMYTFNGFGAVCYAKINADGSLGATSSSSLPNDSNGFIITNNVRLAVANGYLYTLGGKDSSPTVIADVNYARIRADGSLGTWTRSTNSLPATREHGGVFIHNGYIYYIDGDNTQGTAVSTMYYAKINADGTTGAFTTTGTSNPSIEYASVVQLDGYVYMLGGYSGSTVSTVNYAPLNSDGTIGTWGTTTSLPQALATFGSTAIAQNGYVYVIGGETTALSSSISQNVYYAKQNSDGTLGLWQTSANSLPRAVSQGAATMYNGYIYYMNGTIDGGTNDVNTIYYTSTSRITVAGTLDLVGIGGQTLSSNGGGNLTANNGIFVGGLTVQGQTSINNSLAVNGNLNVGGTVLAQSTTNTLNYFQVQNAIGSSVLSIDTTNVNANITNGSFENSDVSAWTAKGTAATPSRDTARSYLGSASLTSNVGTASGNGIKYGTTSLTNGATYSVSFYIRQVSGTALSSTNFAVGWNNGTSDTNCTLTPALTTQAPSTSGWVRYSCTFTASTAGGSHLYWKLNSAVGSAVTFNIDAVQVELTSSTSYKETAIQLNGLVNSALTIQNSNDSTNAVSIQNSSGTSLLSADTLNNRIVLGANTLGNATATTTTGTTSGTGGSNVTSITLSAAGSFANNDVIFVDNTGGSGQDFYTRITAGGGTTTLTVSPAVSYGSAAGYTGNAAITKYNAQYIGSDGNTFTGAVRSQNSFYQGYFTGGIVTGTGSTVYSDGNINSANAFQFVAPSYILQATSGTGTAFQVQNSSGKTLLNVDTTGNQISLGTAGPSGQDGKLVFNNATNSNTVSIVTGATSGTYSLTLPTAGPSTSQCLQTDSVTASQLVFAACAAGGSGVTTVGAIDTPSKSANGAHISGSSIYLQTADASNPGLVSTGTQTFAGAKTFQSSSATGFVVQNTSSGSLLSIDSSTSNITLLGNNDGQTSAWTNQGSNLLPAFVQGATSVAANGYVYVFGGNDSGGTAQTNVFYAKLNADGSTGAWTSQGSNVLPSARVYASSVTANGYAYVLGGDNTSGTPQTSVFYAKLNADGSTGAWTNQGSNLLPAARYGATSVIANGYVYVLGGSNSGVQTSVFYAKLNADGSTGAWTNQGSNLLPTGRTSATSVVSNGYAYIFGGSDGTNLQTSVLYAKLNADGSTGAWTSQGSNLLSGVRSAATSVAVNGYAYVLGGLGPGFAVQNTVLYSSLSRVKIGGNLDLVGLQGGSYDSGTGLSLGSVGGSITAGNIFGIGDLQIQGQGSFAQGLSASSLSLSLPGSSNIGNSTIQGLSISSGSITQNTASATGTFVGQDITVPSLTLTSGTALNAYGLRITTGSMTQTAGALTQNGIYVDSGSTTFTTGGTLNGINVNVGDIASVGTYNGLNISTNGTNRTFSAGATIAGINIDLSNTGGNTATGTTEYGIKVLTSTNSNMANSQMFGVSVTGGGTITQNSNSPNNGIWYGFYASQPLLSNTSTSGTLTVHDFYAGLAGYTQNTAATTNINGIEVGGGGSTITQQTNAGTINYEGGKITLPALNLSSGSGFINANGLKVVTNTQTQTAGTVTQNGLNVDIGGNINSGTFNGLNIAASTARTIGSNLATGINLDLQTNVSADAVNLKGMQILTAGNATNSIQSATKTGLYISSGSIIENTAAATGTYLGIDVAAPALTLTSGTALNSFGARITNGAATSSAGTLTENGLAIITGNITQSGGNLTQNGLYVDSTTNTPTSGTLNGIKISGVNDNTSTTTTALSIGAGWDNAVSVSNGLIIETPTTPILTGTGNTGTAANQVAVAGRYAYIARGGNSGTCSSGTATGCELQVWDVTKPSSPVFAGGVDAGSSGTSTRGMQSIAVYGQYAFVGLNSSIAASNCTYSPDNCEINIYNISNPSSPTFVTGIDGYTSGGVGGNTVYSIYISGRYLYAATGGDTSTCSATTRDGCELKIFDISNPTTPKFIGGADSQNTAGGSATARSVFVSGKYAYLATGDASSSACSSGNHCELNVYDISNPTNPTFVSGVDSTNAGTGVNLGTSVYVVGSYLYLGMNTASGTCSSADKTGCTLQIYSITNPSSPVYQGGIDQATIDTVRSINVAGKYAYVSTDIGLNVVDVTTPSSPSNLGSTSGDYNFVTVSGRYAYAATNSSSGLYVLDLTGVEATTITAGSLEAGLLQVREDALIYNNLSIGLGLNVGTGGIASQGSLSIDVSAQSSNSSGSAPSAAKFVGGSVEQTPSRPVYVGGGDTSAGSGADDTNAVYVSGNYAYVGKIANAGTCSSSTATGCEFQIWDMGDKTSPKYLGGIDTSGGDVKSIVVSGKYAYVALAGALKVYDVSIPTSPSSVGSVGSITPSSVAISGRYLYVAVSAGGGTCNSTTSTGCEFVIYDVANPASPVYVGGNDTALSTANTVSISGRYAYVGAVDASGTCNSSTRSACELQIEDISDPTNPTFVGGGDTGTGNGIGVQSVYVSGRYAYIAKAENSATCSSSTDTGCEFQVWDVSNPASPVYKGGSDSDTSGSGVGRIKSVYVSGSYAYIARSGAGATNTCNSVTYDGCELQVFNVSDPTNPTFVGGKDTISGSNLNGLYAVFVSGHYAYVGQSGNSGTCNSTVTTGCEIQVYDISGVIASSITAGSIVANLLQVNDNAMFYNQLSVSGGLSVGAGGIYSEGSISTSRGLSVQLTQAPTTDIATVSNSGFSSATTGVDGISLSFGSSGASGDALHITPSFTGTGNTFNGIEIDALTMGASSGSNNINGFKIGNLSENGTTTSVALNIGSGWDNVLMLNGTTLINGSGIVSSAAISGPYTGITGTGALDAGSITSNFGSINIGTDTITSGAITAGTINTTGITTTGTVTFSAVAVDITTGTNEDLNIAPNGTGNITIGTSDTVGTALILDTKTGSGDPSTTTDGAMYYNSNSGKFRCRENGAWVNCITTARSNIAFYGGASALNTATATDCVASSNLGLTLVRPGTTNIVTMDGYANARLIVRGSIASGQGQFTIKIRNVTDGTDLVGPINSGWTTTCATQTATASISLTGQKKLECEWADSTTATDDPNLGQCSVELY